MISRLLLVLVLVGCNDDPPVQDNDPVAEDNPIAPSTQVPIEIHEWGLLDGESLHAGHPSRAIRPALRAPVLYAHLPESLPQDWVARFDLRVKLGTNHRVMEHYPGGGALMPGETLAWAGVTLSPGACSEPRQYPRPPSSGCRTEDGVCEAAHGRRWETADGACMLYGEKQWDHFFYRVTMGPITLPFSHELDGTTVKVQSQATLVGMVYRTNNGMVTWAEPPSTGATTELALPTESNVDAARERIKADLGFHGLTSDEADAFLREWHDLFAGQHLMYWIPSASLDEIATLEGEGLTFKRAVLVRVSL